MSKQMKLIMENFNKFIEGDKSIEQDIIVNSIIDDILGGVLMESILKEFGGTASQEDMEEFGVIPKKEEAKEAIKQALETPGVQQQIQKIDDKVQAKLVPNPNEQDYEYAIKSVLKDFKQDAKIIGTLMVASPTFLALGGGLLFGPSEGGQSETLYHYNPAAYEAAVAAGNKAAMIGGSVGLAFAAVVAAGLIYSAVQNVQKRADKEALHYGRTKKA